MNGKQIEVADIFRRHGADYLEAYGNETSNEQRRVLRAIVNCRTAALGGQLKKCDSCGHTEIYFHSCRNRHCPKCQAAANAEWLDARARDLLEGVQYFHVVFTIPDKLSPVALQNKRVLYGILFRAVAETLVTIARDPKHLGARIGFSAVMHTWGQNLLHHPHIHCVVPGGGISPDGDRWIPCRKDFFLPVRVMSSLFRKKFLFYLRKARKEGEFAFHGKLENLRGEGDWRRFLKSLNKTNWVVYAKPPFGGPDQVLKYLARYTHRVAISNQRILSLEDGRVTFRWKDYRNGNRHRTMTLDAVEFIRRFLLHVLPKGFMRIRHYGFLSNRNRREKLALCRKLLEGGNKEEPKVSAEETQEEQASELMEHEDSTPCPVCREGRMAFVETVEPYSQWAEKRTLIAAYNTS